MSERERLRNRRAHTLFDFEAMGMRFTGSVSRYPDGRISEIFLDNHKAGSAIGTLCRDIAIVFSFAAQHGADVEAIRRALCRDSQGRPLGPLGVALDIIATDLKVTKINNEGEMSNERELKECPHERATTACRSVSGHGVPDNR
jgi:hypothetical protein